MALPWIYLEIEECTSLCTSGFWLCFSETRREGGRAEKEPDCRQEEHSS